MIEDDLREAARHWRDRLDFPMSFARSGEPFRRWRDKTRELVRATLEIGTLSSATAEIMSEATSENGVSQRLRLRLADGETTEAFLLTPAGRGPFPAVLLFHDHGSEFRLGKEKLIEPWDDFDAAALHRDWSARFYGGRSLGAELVRRGYCVMCADAIGWGSRQGNGYASQQALAANLMQVGTSLAAVVAREDVQAAAYLMAHPQVDASRVAAAGFSFGGFRAWQTAALVEGIAATVCANWMSTLRALLVPGNNILRGQSAFYMLHPALAGQLDFPDFASLIAPRPALFQAGSKDRHFPEAGVRQAFATLEAAWAAAGQRDGLAMHVSDWGHVFDAAQQDAAFSWLDSLLRP